ncbi:isoprenylcysteine carboxylmethyltransferase family protein [Nocardioides sp. GY 10127]|uniref:methyltransferase family protein n=1 Tax=Nocardioides sp. GY 10127 TaxID=2569762 RepID=UPI001F0F436E|nr:isoprenylcysteine carboxylmethyltransferase family protein [Nocardioides sp. GY 10127]
MRITQLPGLLRLPAVQLVQALLAQRRLGAPQPATTVAAAAVAVPSLALGGAALAGFRRAGTTWHPEDPSAAEHLVTDGVNALTRNPMYVGLAGLLLAHAVHRRSLRALLPAVAFVVSLDRGQVRREEAALAERFGADWDAYAAAVPRWCDGRTLAAARGLLGR